MRERSGRVHATSPEEVITAFLNEATGLPRRVREEIAELVLDLRLDHEWSDVEGTLVTLRIQVAEPILIVEVLRVEGRKLAAGKGEFLLRIARGAGWNEYEVVELRWREPEAELPESRGREPQPPEWKPA